MGHHYPKVSSVLILATLCLGQERVGPERGGVDPRVALPLIENVLRTAHISASLVYSGQCWVGRPIPDFPSIRALSDYSGPAREVLQKMFAGDPHMRITQEPEGIIRMVETDVPTDLLDFKIHHMSFYTPEAQAPHSANVKASVPTDLLNFKIQSFYTSWSQPSHGPNMALLHILANPEVRAFRKEHNIGPNPDSFLLPGDGMSSKPIVYGKLDDVTVSQALDYVLKAFPGFWLYESCVNKGGDRSVYLSFFETIQPMPDEHH